MEYKTIVVHLDAHPRRLARLEIALQLAERAGAHLVGLFAVDLRPVPRSPEGEWGSSLICAIEEQRSALRDIVQLEFKAAVARYAAVPSEWREDGGGALEAVSLSARYADLVVVGQHQPDAKVDSQVGSHLAEDLVFVAPCPMLVVPYVGRFDTLGERVLLAWNSSPNALRAVTGAMPILKLAREVSVMVFDAEKSSEAHGQVPGGDISLFLARHEVKATLSSQRSVGGDIGCTILSRAADMSADLIVMGAYSHSRTRERILGGATRTIFESMTVPVLMSH